MSCPVCGLSNVPSAARCDCGCDLATGASPTRWQTLGYSVDLHIVAVAYVLGLVSLAAGALTGSGGVWRWPTSVSRLLRHAFGLYGDLVGYVCLGAVPFVLAGALLGVRMPPFWKVLGAFLAGITCGYVAAIVYVNIIPLLPCLWTLAACCFAVGFLSVRALSKVFTKRSGSA